MVQQEQHQQGQQNEQEKTSIFLGLTTTNTGSGWGVVEGITLSTFETQLQLILRLWWMMGSGFEKNKFVGLNQSIKQTASCTIVTKGENDLSFRYLVSYNTFKIARLENICQMNHLRYVSTT